MTDQKPEEVEKSDKPRSEEDVEGHRMGRKGPEEDAAKSSDDGDDVEGHKMGRK